MIPSATTQRAPRTALTLLALESLPCGCVSGVYGALPTVVELELVEAKGPHCLHTAHRAGGVVRLGLPEEFFDEGPNAAL